MPVYEFTMAQAKDLARLQWFVRAVQGGSITAAAREYGAPQSMVSTQVKQFEESVRAKLFLRSSNKAIPTAAAKTFARDIQNVLDLYDRACRRVRAINDKSARKLRVGFSLSPTEEFRVATFERFRRENADILVIEREVQVKHSMSQLLRDKLDLALVVEPPLLADPCLYFEPLTKLSVQCAVAINHPLASKAFVTKDEIRRQTILGFSREDLPQYYAYFDRWFAPDIPEVIDDFGEARPLLKAIAQGDGVGVLLSSAGRMLQGVRMLPIRPSIPTVAVGAMYVKCPSPNVKKLVQTAKAVISGNHTDTPRSARRS